MFNNVNNVNVVMLNVNNVSIMFYHAWTHTISANGFDKAEHFQTPEMYILQPFRTVDLSYVLRWVTCVWIKLILFIICWMQYVCVLNIARVLLHINKNSNKDSHILKTTVATLLHQYNFSCFSSIEKNDPYYCKPKASTVNN